MRHDDAGIAVTEEDEQKEVIPTVVEWSGDGAVMVETDWSGRGYGSNLSRR